ncbi:class II fructose-bisphosphate aldolase [Schumannella luteola]
MLSTAAEILAGGRAVAAFNVITLEYAQGIVAGATARQSPVLLSVSHNAVRYHGSLAPIAAACLALADGAAVPVGLHLDHCEDPALIEHAIDLGFGSVMIDASTLPYDENVELTARVADLGRSRGVWVEAELGEIGGKDGAHAPGVRTDPAEAAEFVAATGVDGLAVAVGTSHAMTSRDARPDLSLIAELAAAVPVPLVLHGSSGVPDDALAEAVAAGIRKVNVGTQLSVDYSDALRVGLADGKADPRAALTSARASIQSTVERLLGVITPVS